jgi:mono/diheme cytochrome c family protein
MKIAHTIAILGLLAVSRASAASVDAERDIWPIFQSRCLECHGPDKQKASLRVDSREALLKGGDEGPVIVPGEVMKSRLVDLVSSDDIDERMPPKGDPLTAEQVGKIREWIIAGAAWPERERGPARQKHWAFVPVARPPVPESPESKMASSNPIDAFVASKLAEHGLRMSAEAKPSTFIRRVTLDLTGLPPTPEEVASFEKAASRDTEGAATALVDRLLASPRYGERWAQHWLDVIRYADTTGYESNAIRPNAWPYRDYVIAALNADIAYPQFILEQLAGDTFGVDAATGFLVTPPFPSRIEIGQEESAIAQARCNGLDEVLQNIGSAVLGMTVGCARCHDHKFDPMTTRDYYRLAANFGGLHFLERPWQRGTRPTEAIKAAEGKLARIRRELAAFPAWREVEPMSAADVFQSVRAKFVRLKVTGVFQKYAPALDEVEVWASGKNVGAALLGAVARSSGADVSLGAKDEFLNDGRRGRESLWTATTRAGQAKGYVKGEAWVEIELPEPMEVDRVAWSSDFDDQNADHVPLRWRYVTDWMIEVAEEPGQWRTVVSDEREDLAKSEQGRRKKLEEQFAAAATGLWELTHVFAGRFRSNPEAMHVLSRGDPMQRREATGPGSIEVLGLYELPPGTPDTDRRVALAKWLGSEQHPLTARVLVNRVWRHHFGAGLVETPGDFGTQGERPTHPELLDWLAGEFMARGWRLKELHRMICTSAAYRQGSAPDIAAAKLDTGARLLWRYPPRRLEAEAIRDSVLFSSGSLEMTAGGPGVSLYQPKVARKDYGEWRPLEDPGPSTWRRSIYLMRMRGADDGVFKPFDVPDCGQVRAKRSDSTTPLQALNLFNSAFIIEQADLLARRAESEAGPERVAQVERVFLLTVARTPSAKELGDCLTVANAHGLAAVCRALFNANEFLFLE